MAPTPIPPPVLDLTSVLKDGLKLNISGTLPGEALLSKIIDLVITNRTTMDKPILARWDLMAVQQAEDLQSVWRGIWKAIGVLPK